MLLNLKDDGVQLESEILSKDRTIKGLNKEEVKNMVRTSRIINPKQLRYSHFNALEVLALFTANNVLDKEIADLIMIKKDEIVKHGMKIYLGVHISDSTLPDRTNKNDYIGKTTTILCNTTIETDVKYGYLFKDKLNEVVAIAQFDDNINAGEGLDQAEICPPYHMTDPEDGDHDAGFPL